ncbi:hypothetical protein POZ06_12135 [Bacteroides uniformis]|nr:hypothetical protein [Bacteroides uniformis]MDC1815517.1 hypothetical protein [Bacteroides uniformis]
MNLLTCILITIPIGIIFIMLWIYNDYRKYKKKNKLVILLFLLFPTTLSAQYVDAGCQVSFKWLENQKGKLEYTKDGVTYKFIPNDSQWEIIIRNNSSEDIRINWENMQFIVDGRTSEVKYPILAKAETPFAIIKSQAETSQKIGVTTYTANKASSRIYNKKDIRKGRNSSITIILPISIGKHPQFFPLSTLSSKKQTNYDFSRYKKTAERTTFLEHCINWSARRTEDKSNAGSKRYHNLASTCSGPASMGKDIKRNTHPGHPEMCIRLYIQ